MSDQDRGAADAESIIGAIAEARNAALSALGGDVRLVDLTRVLGPDSVMWPGSLAPSVIDRENSADGSTSRVMQLHEHSGTHLDAPSHYVPGGDDTATLALDRLVVAARVLDISAQARRDPNATLQPETVLAHESEYGPIPPGSAVLLHTGWTPHFADAATDFAFPAFGVEAARLLVERGVVGLGVDSLGIDPGNAGMAPVHRTVTHRAGLWHLENLTNLDQLPPVGALLIAGVPRLAGGTGFPTRAFAMVPGSFG
ncbi:MAG: cyclase family protein [Nakamurella sp.]